LTPPIDWHMSGGPLEKDTCRDVILPALVRAGWNGDAVREQAPVREARIISVGGASRQLGDGFVDYVLEVDQAPVAVVETKRAHRQASDGLQQVVRYAQQLDVPLAYASNGTEIIERDMVSGRERVVEGFAGPAEAWSR
jgi:Type I site-specific restriction-modification system, R (restriction) subunit and related helicases